MFAIPGFVPGRVIQHSVDALRCQLVNRDTDVRVVDIIELPDAAATLANEKRVNQGVLAELALLRSQGCPDFEVALIGKDGGVKVRTGDPNALDDFLALIETMPMRQAELRS